MAPQASVSPHKVASRHALQPPDPTTVRLPESPDKNNRSLRRPQSHAQLSTTQGSLRSRNGLGIKSSREQLTMKSSKEQLIMKPSRDQLNPPTTTHTSSIPARTRANSDAVMPFERQKHIRKPLTAITNPQIPSGPMHARKSSLEVTLRDGPAPGVSPSESLSLLRHSILTSGVAATKEGMSDYRIYLWLTLLNIGPLSTDIYLSFIHRGRSPFYEKISNDVFRTLTTDILFKRRVTDASLTRVLNATAWRIHDEQQKLTTETPNLIQTPYVQGVNVLSAPLLYASRSEAQAYALLTVLLKEHLPGYISPTMSGVHAGLDLMDRVLAHREPNLASYLLETHKLPAKIYAFPSVLTLCACTPALPEVLKLWDFLFAFGVHLNVVCVVAQLILMKQKLYDSPSPGTLLRSFPQLDAQAIIGLTLVIVRDLPEDLYAEIVKHARV